MKQLATIASFLLVLAKVASAQPMSGNYTVGGDTPSFATPQDAANAIKSLGVSGPVFINIRPGTYMRNGGTSPVLVMDSIVAGVSATNRITFQPDAASGGNVSNVILQADFNNINNSRRVAQVGADYVALRNLTFKDADSLDTPSLYLVEARAGGFNTTIEGLVVDGCRFLGNPNIGQTFGTDFGIGSDQRLQGATITNNRFYRLLRAVSIENGANRGGTLIVEDNEFYAGYQSVTGSGNPLGTAIQLACVHAFVRRNVIDYTGGNGCTVGIEVIFASEAFIERNVIKNISNPGTVVFTAIATRTLGFPIDSIIIANNMIAGNVARSRGGIEVRTPNTKILYNSILNPSGSNSSFGIRLYGANCTVLNNIINEFGVDVFLGFVVAFDQGNATQSPGLISNYNIIDRAPQSSGALVISGGQSYMGLNTYQSATGKDTNSVSKTISFISETDLHVDQCQAQDADLVGIPVPSVQDDFDGAQRDPVRPFKGADESVRMRFDMFADPFRAGLPGVPFSLAAANHDNIPGDDLAVPDYDNRQIHMFHNLPQSRSFSNSGTIFTSFRPSLVKFFDLDGDTHLDLIASGDTNAIAVFWGDGAGGFSSPTTVGTTYVPGSMEPNSSSSSRSITLTEGSRTPTLQELGFLGYVRIFPGRSLCHDLQLSNSTQLYDTVSANMKDFVIANVGGDATPEVLALSVVPLPPKLILFKDIFVAPAFPFPPCPLSTFGTSVEYQLSTGSPSNTSSIVAGDFDGDGDNDLVTNSPSSAWVVLIRNQGNFTFTSELIDSHYPMGLVALDYENDGDLDFVTVNFELQTNGIGVFLNDGSGHFVEKPNCFLPFASGTPFGVVASDFDLDGRTDIAIASSYDSLFVLYNLGGGITGVNGQKALDIPQTFSLEQNYPNPFNPSTRIEYALPAQSHVSVKIYNLLGQEVASLVDAEKLSGHHAVEWNGRSVSGLAMSSGVYFYRVEARPFDGQSSFTSVKKMVLMK